MQSAVSSLTVRRASRPLIMATLGALALFGAVACGDSGGGSSTTDSARDVPAASGVDAAPAAVAAGEVETIGIPDGARRVTADQSFVGSVDGTDIYVAVNVTDAANSQSGQTEVDFYFCDDADVSISSYGTLADGRVETEIVSAQVADELVTGTVVVDGETLEFSAAPATGASGLYVADEVDAASEAFLLSGFWIRAGDDSFRGVQNGTTRPIQLGGTAGPAVQDPKSSGTVDIELQTTCRRLRRIMNRTRMDAFSNQDPGAGEYWAAATEHDSKCPNVPL
jgi:hypothetical protein